MDNIYNDYYFIIMNTNFHIFIYIYILIFIYMNSFDCYVGNRIAQGPSLIVTTFGYIYSYIISINIYYILLTIQECMYKQILLTCVF